MIKYIKNVLLLTTLSIILLLFIPNKANADASNYRQYNNLDYIYNSIVGNSGFYGNTSIAGNFGALDGNGGNNAIGYTNSQYYYAKQRLIDIGRVINKSQIVSIELKPVSYNSNARFYIADNNQSYVDTGITFNSSNGVQASSIFISGDALPVSNVRYFKTTSSSCNDGEQIVIHMKDTIPPSLSLTPNTTNWTNSVTINANSWDNIGIQSIQTPDGNWTNSSNVNYTVYDNNVYNFAVRDTSGNVSYQGITISNIDKSSPSATSVSVQNQDENGYDIYVYGAYDSQSGVNRIQFPTWTSNNSQDDIQSNWWSNPSANGQNLGGGTWKYHVDKSSHNYEMGQYNTHVYIYDNVGNYSCVSTLQPTLIPNDDATIVSNDIPTTMEAGKQYTVHITVKNTGCKTWDSNYRLGGIGDSDPFANARQYLPNGVTIAPGTSYTFTFVMTAPSTSGTYVSDWRMVHEGIQWFGLSISKTINIIDTTAPSLTLTPSTTNWTNGNIVITATGYDVGSGVKNIKTPDNNYISGSTTNYIVEVNGIYNFVAYDNAGNQITKSITINNIDKTEPTGTVTQSFTSWTNKVILTATGSDGESGVKSITKPDGGVINSNTTTYEVYNNGIYNFIITDNAGNTFVKSYTISNIDNISPTLNLTQDKTEYTNGTVIIFATSTDGESGVSQIQLPNNIWINGAIANYTVTSNGTYKFSVKDNVGNITTKTITVSNIDKETPTLTLTQNSTWTNGSTTINIKATDDMSGVKQIILSDGNIVPGDIATYTVSEVGAYYFKAIDNVGNIGINYIIVSNIDKNKPSVIITNNKNWSNSNSEPVIITATDN